MGAIPELRTERLLPRPFTPADADAIQAPLSTPDIAATTLNIPYPYPEGAALAWTATMREIAEAEHAFRRAITRNDNGSSLGSIALGVTDRHRRGELGYWLGIPSWNRGFMSEATRRVITFGFDRLGLHRIEANGYPRDAASARVMMTDGMRYGGTLRGYVRKGDTSEGIAMYAASRSDLDVARSEPTG
ncbi:MAG: GNAT family N-acetyltransferase [Thermomicrobiales bacterium]